MATLVSNQNLVTFLRFFTNLLPLRRVYEAVIARYLLEHGRISLTQAHGELAKHLSTPHWETIEYAFKFLTGDFFDSAEARKYHGLLFQKSGSDLVLSSGSSGLMADEVAIPWIMDLLQYGIIRYELEFGAVDFGVPHLKLWEQYTMRDLAYLSNVDRTHSSFRGQGLLTTDKHYFIFVDLNKDEDVKDSVNYKDKFIDTRNFQWETPNSTAPETNQGQQLINHSALGISMHLFARKFREIEGTSQPFTYFGKVNYHDRDLERSKPMRIYYILEHEIPTELYYEITTRV